MSLTTTENLRDETDKLFRHYIDGIKARTKSNLNDAAVNGEGFIRNFLNLLYGFNLHREKIESAYNETIDLHNLGHDDSNLPKICVQVTARNDKSKVDATIDSFIKKKKYKNYDEFHFFILDREKSFKYDTNKLKSYNTEIVFHDYTTIFKKLCLLDCYKSIFPIYEFVQQELGSSKGKIIYPSEFKERYQDFHIVDKLHGVLKSFNGLGCIHPRTISKLWPFTTSEYRYDSFSRFCLKTDNKDIHILLEQIEIKDFEITIHDKSLESYRKKLEEIFTILNDAMIYCICYREKYTEIKHHKINIERPKIDCKCNLCRYKKYDIAPLFDKLKGKAIDPSEDSNDALSEAYYLFKLGEPVKSWVVLDKIIKRADNSVVKFIAELNIKDMYGSINTPWNRSEAKSILPKIDEIDFLSSLLNSTNSREVRDELIRIKEDFHLHDSRRRIEDLAEKILENRFRYSKGRGIFLGPSYITQLWNELTILTNFYLANSLIVDSFLTFQNTIRKGIEATFNSYTTSDVFEDRYKEFDEFIVFLILEYLSDKDFEKILKDAKLSEIIISESAKPKILEKIKNYFDFQVIKDSSGSLTFYEELEKQDYFSHFRQDLRQVFNNIMMFLQYSNYSSEELILLSDSILDFIQTSEDFSHNNWKYFIRFLEKKVQVFTPQQIKLIIDQVINGKNHRAGEDQLKTICYIASSKAGLIIKDEKEIKKLLKSTLEPCSHCNLRHHWVSVLSYWSIFNDEGKKLVKQYAIQELLKKFDGQLYQESAFEGILTLDNHLPLFNKFIDYAVSSCKAHDIIQVKDRWVVKDFTGINALSCLDFMGFDLQNKRLKKIEKKSQFYNWVINMREYDYSDFDHKWLTDLCILSFLQKRVQGINTLKTKVEDTLKTDFDSKLSDFYVKYLL